MNSEEMNAPVLREPEAIASAAAMGAGRGPESPARLAWRRLRRNRTAMLGGLILVVLYALAILGSFFAVRDPSKFNYEVVNHPPTVPRFVDENGQFHFRPFVYKMTMTDPEKQVWEYTAEKFPLHFFVKGDPYTLWWFIKTDRHFWGVDKGGLLAPLGTDGIGRCVFSRTLEGGKVSLSIGVVALSISLLIGMAMGAMAGYYGGLMDAATMRLVEFLMSVPTLYMIIALRAYFQSEGVFGIGGSSIGSGEMYVIIVVILSLIGWAGLARVIRGMVLSIKEQDFVMAERAIGAGTARILAYHVLPNTMSYVIISATIAIPGYILGEVALTFLGVGIQEPAVSWGNMLDQARSLQVLKNTPWLMLAPGGAIFLTVMAFNFLGDGLRDALDPKHIR
jgi:peptide/nickel transport system permease protein